MELRLHQDDIQSIARIVIAGLQQKPVEVLLTSQEAMRKTGYKTYTSFRGRMSRERILPTDKGGRLYWKESDIKKFMEN